MEILEGKYDSLKNIEEISRKISEIDELITLQLNKILHHPEFKTLEANWRGLYYLVNQIEFNLKVKINVLQASKKDILKDFDRSEIIERTFFYKIFFSDVFRFGAPRSFGLLIGAYEFDHLFEDISILEKMSEIAAKAHLPFIASASPNVFYMKKFDEIHDFRDMSKNFEQRQFDRWHNFRKNPNSKYTALCLPHILLRENYKTAKNFEFRESVEKQNMLWGNAAFAFAGCVARAYFEKGWLGKIRGLETDGEITGLISQTFDDNEREIKSSLDTNLQKYFPELTRQGFLTLLDDLGGKPYFFGSQSTHKPPIYDSENANQVARMWSQIENILAVSRFAVNLMTMRIDNFHRYKEKDELRRVFMNWLASYFHDSDSATEEEKAQKPLREFIIYLEEIREKPEEFKGVLFIRPTYLLEDPKIAARLEIYFPSPNYSDF